MRNLFKYYSVVFLAFSLAILFPASGVLAQEKTGGSSEAQALELPGEAQRLVKEGISVDLNISSVIREAIASKGLMEGEDAVIQFRIVDTVTQVPMTGLKVAAWIDPRDIATDPRKKEGGVATCREKIQWFLQGSLALQPAIDLNTYFMLTLNDRASISVIDPQLGFYTSKLITTIPLKGPGEDWVLSRDGKRLFVTIPKAKQVAVVDTAVWKVTAYIVAGPNPARIALQPDEKYLWVGNDADDEKESGITVLDPEKLVQVARLKTGMGHHEIAFAGDSSHVFVTNRAEDTLSVIDTQKLKEIRKLKTGADPVSLAYSEQANAVYVAHEDDGRIVVVDGKSHEIITSIQAKPGLRAIRFSPDKRWGFAVNYRENVVHILDSSVNRILYDVDVEPKPDQVTFSDAFAYVRSVGSEQVNMIQLSLLGREKTIPALKIPAGRVAPEKADSIGLADAIVQTPERDMILVANPADKTIYYHMEGMLAPMGSFQTYGFESRGVAVVDRSFREVKPGIYSTTFKLPASGTYDVAFLLEFPRVNHCFEMAVVRNPAIAERKGPAVRMEFVSLDQKIKVGEETRIQFKLLDPNTNQPRVDLKDFGALYFPTASNWQGRVLARQVSEDGMYEVEISAPTPGYYQVFFECPSLNLRFDQMPVLTLQATKDE